MSGDTGSASVKKKVQLGDLIKAKAEGQQIAWVTSYDFPMAYAAEHAGIDMILVGDSGGMVQLGYPSTNPVTMDEMIHFAKAVRRGAPNTFVIGDMPQGAYEISQSEAVRSALRFAKEALCDAIKCEGGRRIIDKVRAMVDAGILVMGHLGLTPQSASSFGGYRVQGRTVESFEMIVEDALALQEAGVFALLLEAMPPESAEQLAKMLKIPVYGIGAGGLLDGQLLIMHDLLGFYPAFRPKFAKCYVPEVLLDFSLQLQSLNGQASQQTRDGFLFLAELAIKKYIDEVRTEVFPGRDYSYKISDKDLHELMQSRWWSSETEAVEEMELRDESRH